MDTTIIVHIVFAVIAISIGLYFGKGMKKFDQFAIGERNLKWFGIALSAGATANSGFIMTTAIALGYLQGISALLLPLAFLIGTLAFWEFFPQRITKLSHEKKLMTISQTLTHDFSKGKSIFDNLIAFLIVVAIILYTAAQWRVLSISLSGFTGLNQNYSIIVSGIFVAIYSMIGFRSYVWVEILLSVIIFAMVLYILFYTYNLYPDKSLIFEILTQKNKDFLDPFNGYTLSTGLGFILGWATASMGFSVSQPEILDKFYAASSPKEATKAKWLYIAFVQITWVCMTLVGVLLSGLVSDLDFSASEKALSTIIAKDMPLIMKALTILVINAAVISTANSLLMAASRSISVDLLKTQDAKLIVNRAIVFSTAVLTIILVFIFVDGSVFDFIKASITLLASSIAPAMIIKLMQWKNSPHSLIACILSGILSALLWRYFKFDVYIHETVPAIIISLATNLITFKLTSTDEK